MGIFRFLLAALVVLFHFGGLGWIVGRIAVFAFYGISGFLIFQVLDRVYLSEPRGIPRFFCNRFVRLVPLYLLYTVLTLAMVRQFKDAVRVLDQYKNLSPPEARQQAEDLIRKLSFF
jgi:peptidoglycan/LPS O-acetylase OafA/YrhL